MQISIDMKHITAGIILATALSASVGCSSKKPSDRGDSPDPTPASAPAPVADSLASVAEAKVGTSGRHRDQPQSDWVPAEFKTGTGQWRDPVIYVDGVPFGVIAIAELPYKLEPVWIEQIEALDNKPGQTGTIARKYKVPRFRMVEYLEAFGLDAAKVTEIHIHSGPEYAAVISGDEMRKHRDDFLFDFANQTRGRIRPYFPDGMQTSTKFDRIGAIAVYIDKQPPSLDDEEMLELDGKPVEGMPYFGEPIRGGVRVYLDDRLATVIKRNKLDATGKLAPVPGQEADRWGLFGYLGTQGVDVSQVEVADLVYNHQRFKRLDREALDTLYFAANPQVSGEVLLGPDRTPVTVIMLYGKKPPTLKQVERKIPEPE